ncbi:DUF3575 domain-containing protein [Elizabethkingia argentiflava]|uniref:DUF3575 domain-containing protein n=1 Tax=Elizabethkingia argenteiflava TaxID=2681556 RepID=A0A845PW72_9FLAO|nr:DUF3575 domain-containing protein [Elizabethkingia argenteiflava]NAW51116.1 DUF3575 domain-containing protein [Elizabethkingia argenteiflava]
MKKKFLLFTLMVGLNVMYAQEYKKQIKGNLLFFPVHIFNIGYEQVFNKHWTGQTDILISPWKSFYGRHMLMYMGHLEARYYFRQALEKWYVGSNIGVSIYDLQKMRYWNSDKYQEGFAVMLGCSIGYQIKLTERWNIDLYAGGGNVQSFYHGWYKNKYPKQRYDSARAWNKSGEWMPFRGGAMLSYKF